MKGLFEPDQLLDAFTVLQTELPGLLGAEDWQAVASAYQDHLSVLQHATDRTERLRAGAELMDLVNQNEEAKNRLAALLDFVDARRMVLLEIADLVKRMQHDTREVSELQRAASEPLIKTKYVKMSPGFKNAKSVKIKNIDIVLDLYSDYGQLAVLALGVVNVVEDIVAKDKEFVALAAILALIGLVYKEATVEIPEQDASVLWGLAEAGRAATEERIRLVTNQVRHERHLEPLSADQIMNSLLNLRDIECVQKVGGTKDSWRAVESVVLKR